jgi:hypothetical protein
MGKSTQQERARNVLIDGDSVKWRGRLPGRVSLESGGFMTQLRERFKWQTESGETVRMGDMAVTPQSQALTVRWPWGGWVWNRPAAVLVERGEERKRIRIVDVTRAAQLALHGLGLVFAIVGLILWTRERSTQDE